MVSENKFHKDLGNRIREIRKKKGLSLRDLEAHDNAIDSAQLSRFENGEKVPMIYTLYKIATVLEVDIAEFLKPK